MTNNKVAGKVTVSERQKLIDTIVSISNGYVREESAKVIVNNIDCSKAYYIEILRSKKQVKNFLEQKTVTKQVLNEEGEYLTVQVAIETNVPVIGNPNFSRVAVKEVKGHPDLTEITDIVKVDEHNIREPFTVIKVIEFFEMEDETIRKDKNLKSQVHYRNVLGILV